MYQCVSLFFFLLQNLSVGCFQLFVHFSHQYSSRNVKGQKLRSLGSVYFEQQQIISFLLLLPCLKTFLICQSWTDRLLVADAGVNDHRLNELGVSFPELLLWPFLYLFHIKLIVLQPSVSVKMQRRFTPPRSHKWDVCVCDKYGFLSCPQPLSRDTGNELTDACVDWKINLPCEIDILWCFVSGQPHPSIFIRTAQCLCRHALPRMSPSLIGPHFAADGGFLTTADCQNNLDTSCAAIFQRPLKADTFGPKCLGSDWFCVIIFNFANLRQTFDTSLSRSLFTHNVMFSYLQ